MAFLTKMFTYTTVKYDQIEKIKNGLLTREKSSLSECPSFKIGTQSNKF